jgi:hypothetical protein
MNSWVRRGWTTRGYPETSEGRGTLRVGRTLQVGVTASVARLAGAAGRFAWGSLRETPAQPGSGLLFIPCSGSPQRVHGVGG